MPAENTVAIERHALGTLDYIRASIEAAGTVAVPGSAGFAMGAVALLAGLLCAVPGLARYLIPMWVGAAPIAIGLGARVIARQARTARAPFHGPARRFVLCLAPALLAGALLTGILAWRDEAALLPGIWLLLYGAAVLSASVMTAAGTSRVIAALGAGFLVLGTAALLAPPRWHDALLAAGFGGLHLACGAVLARRAAASRPA